MMELSFRYQAYGVPAESGFVAPCGEQEFRSTGTADEVAAALVAACDSPIWYSLPNGYQSLKPRRALRFCGSGRVAFDGCPLQYPVHLIPDFYPSNVSERAPAWVAAIQAEHDRGCSACGD